MREGYKQKRTSEYIYIYQSIVNFIGIHFKYLAGEILFNSRSQPCLVLACFHCFAGYGEYKSNTH